MREDILRERYYWKDKHGNPLEDWAGLCKRVAGALANDGIQEKQFFDVIHDCFFLPNSPALTNAGREAFTLSACFVLPIEDSVAGIFDTAKHSALVHKMGGGTGFSFDRLRPAGDSVGTTQGIASGPCSFLKIYNASTEVMKQGGTRRGANMGMLRVDHPDIFEFIGLKENDGTISNFNLSVAVTDAFMEAVRDNTDFPLQFDGKTRRTVKARAIWDKIMEGAWRNGEPGVFFIDKANLSNPTPHVGAFEGTNPCGEQPLLPYEACVLGSINLSKMVSPAGDIDWDLLRTTTRVGTVMLDNIIDRQDYPLPQVEVMHKSNRKIGVGVMGWADMLIKLGIHYASDAALTLAEEVMCFITGEAVKMSTELADAQGPFPNWEGSAWSSQGIKVRNATLTTIAPTGTLSIMAKVNGGIEPVFDFRTIERRADVEYENTNQVFEEWQREHPGKPLPDYFVKANSVPAEWHVRMQAAFQKHTHNAISKTINFPKTASKEDVERAYLLAYSLGCKGLTVYRDGSRVNQVITSGSRTATAGIMEPMKMPEVKPQKGLEIETSEGTVHISVTIIDDKPFEVFITTPVESKHSEVYEALARIFSISLRCGVPAPLLLRQIEDANKKYGSVVSPTYAILRAFRKLDMNGGSAEMCPECGNVLAIQEGCQKCLGCGFSKC
jgi:ribonucleoside-diphosphate reductase alpha chain